VALNQPLIAGRWHKNAKETILFYFLLAPPNHSLGSFIMRRRLSGYGKVPRGNSHDHVATHSRSTVLTSAFPLLCFIHNSWRANFQGTSQGRVATSGQILATTTWHSCGLLPSFAHGVGVAAIDVRSHTSWVRRALQPGELMTAFEIPAGTQSTFTPEVITKVCASEGRRWPC
jgi:hypothetical protein